MSVERTEIVISVAKPGWTFGYVDEMLGLNADFIEFSISTSSAKHVGVRVGIVGFGEFDGE